MKGSESDINVALNLLEYKPSGFDDVKLFYNIEELNLNTLDNSGMKSGESTASYSAPTSSGASCADPAGYTAGTSCTGTCTYTNTIVATSGTVPVNGHIYALD
jgi:hypothetical protein